MTYNMKMMGGSAFARSFCLQLSHRYLTDHQGYNWKKRNVSFRLIYK